jgi:hypothetical protein
MTTPDQRYQATRLARRLLTDLLDPGKTPRVPSQVRDRARQVLKHFPLDTELDIIAISCPDLLDSRPAVRDNTDTTTKVNNYADKTL